uniref:Uncharacterized protein n=1 Tax=White sucker hepatitis B virus TaxID=1690672 RepID=A0A7U3QRJ3_9HEPA|nr:hypothetical protein [White sucker hepatitis B virus]
MAPLDIWVFLLPHPVCPSLCPWRSRLFSGLAPACPLSVLSFLLLLPYIFTHVLTRDLVLYSISYATLKGEIASCTLLMINNHDSGQLEKQVQ